MRSNLPFLGTVTFAVALSAGVLSVGNTAQGADLVSADILQPIDPARLCAVSAPNAKIEGAGGVIHAEDAEDDDHASRGYGALTIALPLTCDIGLQVDGSIGKAGGEHDYSAAAHLFARDPASHLLGLYGGHSEFYGNTTNRLGVEGELYMNQLTLSAVGGWEDSDRSDENYFAAGQISWYATDNFKLSAGVARSSGITFGTYGVEWQPDASDISFFVQGAAGEDDYATIFAGVRWHWGAGQKSLIRRHREDDPIGWENILKVPGEEEEENLIVTENGVVCPPPPGPILNRIDNENGTDEDGCPIHGDDGGPE